MTERCSRRVSKISFAIFVVAAAVCVMACSGTKDDDKKGDVCSVCEANVQECGGGFYCDPLAKACAPSSCPSPFFASCADEKTRQVCGGESFVNTACAELEVCSGGACVPETCADGETRCGYQALLTCNGGTWSAAPCGNGQTCYVVSGVGQCAGLVCEPGSRECHDSDEDGIYDTVRVCAGDGTGSDTSLHVDCAANNGFCEGGFCRCGTPPPPIEPTADTTVSIPDIQEPGGIDIVIPGSDFVEPEPDLPPVQIPDKGEVVLDGDTIEFKSYASVNFLQSTEQPGLGTLQIVIAGGTKQVEIQISGVTSDWVGYVDADTVGSIGGFIGYNDGTTPPDIPFKYGAGGDYGGNYAIIIEENGERVIGEFSGILNIVPGQQGPEQIDMEDGFFDIAGNTSL